MRRLVISLHTTTTVFSSASHTRGGQTQQRLLPSLGFRRKHGIYNAKASFRFYVSSLPFLSPSDRSRTSLIRTVCAAGTSGSMCVQRRSVSIGDTANKAKKTKARGALDLAGGGAATEAVVATTTKQISALRETTTCDVDSANEKVSAVQGTPIVTAKRKTISGGGGGSATSPRRHAATVVQVEGDDPAAANNSTPTALKGNSKTGKQKKDSKGEEENAKDTIAATTHSKKKCVAKSHKQQHAQSANNNLSTHSHEVFFTPTAAVPDTTTNTTARPASCDDDDNTVYGSGSGWSAVVANNNIVGDDNIMNDNDDIPANDVDGAEGTRADNDNDDMTMAATKGSTEKEASVDVVVKEVSSLHHGDPPPPHQTPLSSEPTSSDKMESMKEHDQPEDGALEEIDGALAPISRSTSSDGTDTITASSSSSSLLKTYEEATGSFFFGKVPRAFLRNNKLIMRRAVGEDGDAALRDENHSFVTGKRDSGGDARYRGSAVNRSVVTNPRDDSSGAPHVRFVRCWMCRASNKVSSRPQATPPSSEDDRAVENGGSSSRSERDPWGIANKGEGCESTAEGEEGGGGGGPQCERCGVPLSEPASFYGSSTNNADTYRRESIQDMDDAAILQQTSDDVDNRDGIITSNLTAANSPKRDPLSPWREDDSGLIRRKTTSSRRHATSQPHSGGGGHGREGYGGPRGHPHRRDGHGAAGAGGGHQPQPHGQKDTYGQTNRNNSNYPPPPHPQRRPHSHYTTGQGGGGGGSNHPQQQQQQHQRNYPNNNNYNTYTQQRQQQQQQQHNDHHHRGGYRREGGSGGAGYQPRPRGGAHR